MLILEITILVILSVALFWQASLIYAQFLGAPSVNSNKEAILEAFKLAEVKGGETVVDLGCGNGSTLILAAKRFGAKGIGIERSPFYYLLAKLNVLKNGYSKDVQIYFGDFKKLERDIQNADVVYLYLLNSVLANIEDWLFSNIRSDTRVVSLAFSFCKHKPIKTSSANNLGRKTKIELYKK